MPVRPHDHCSRNRDCGKRRVTGCLCSRLLRPCARPSIRADEASALLGVNGLCGTQLWAIAAGLPRRGWPAILGKYLDLCPSFATRPSIRADEASALLGVNGLRGPQLWAVAAPGLPRRGWPAILGKYRHLCPSRDAPLIRADEASALLGVNGLCEPRLWAVAAPGLPRWGWPAILGSCRSWTAASGMASDSGQLPPPLPQLGDAPLDTRRWSIGAARGERVAWDTAARSTILSTSTSSRDL